MTTINPADNNQKISAIAASEIAQNQSEGNLHSRKLAEILLSESDKNSSEAKAKEEKAQEHAALANQLKQKADEIRKLAEKFRKGGIDVQAIDGVKAIAEQHSITDIPIPKDASPERVADYLNQIANRLDSLANEHRRRADDLLKAAEESTSMAQQYREQAQQIKQSEDPSDLKMKSVMAKNEKLNMVFKKLGIYNLDAQYKEQVAYSERKVQEQAQK